MSVERLVTMIKQHSLQNLYETMSDLLISMDNVCFKSATQLDEAIHSLDIIDHSAAICCLLLHKINLATELNAQLFSQLSEFIIECDGPQVRHVIQHFATLCHRLTDRLIDEGTPMKGIDLLVQAIKKVEPNRSVLTSIHADLCKLCLVAKCLKPVLPFLDADISDISKENDQFDVKYYLLYYYYGGIIYATLRNFERSFHFFHSVISVNGTAISEIAIEAYKKFILISLLQYNHLDNEPKSSQAYLNRCVRPFCFPYQKLANAYENESITTMQSLLDQYRNQFVLDQNVGLIKQVITSLVKLKVKKLTQTFITVSIEDLAAKVTLSGSVSEAEKLLLQMIEDEEVFASIDQQAGMVSFSDKPEHYNTPSMYLKLEKEINECFKLNEKLKELEQEMTLTQKYQKVIATQEMC